ncbi:hypothetical protein J8273_2346 [Carpediemonas membranifera]|uniref:Uncharacterized protein n=1 Tax=Carpediemonas membranifera TaxID=201153 RepID=A0A8J6BEV5_9EUKA|nr:hypothetical protein J8273_2346 [Carpediemonas membranifera]|eukprot:KAG9395997.1 hypothetical protein J8273_2346 [Carpediemonas membranifera]
MGQVQHSTGLDRRRTRAKRLIIDAYWLAVLFSHEMAGDCPSLIAEAARREYRLNLPLDSGNTAQLNASRGSIELLIATLLSVPKLRSPGAQVLLDRAISILTDGPELSTTVRSPLDNSPRFHALPRGMLWACLISAGTDNDMDDPKPPHSYSDPDVEPTQARWFLCRRTRDTHASARTKGAAVSSRGARGEPDALLFAGKLFIRGLGQGGSQFGIVRLPRVSRVAVTGSGDRPLFVIISAKGIFGLGDDRCGVLGLGYRDIDMPTRLVFLCPSIAEHEASLPPWHKDRLVSHALFHEGWTLIATPAGMMCAGDHSRIFAQGRSGAGFRRVDLPAGFVPDHMRLIGGVVLLSHGDRQLIAGRNDSGQLGVGHRNELSAFTDPLCHIDDIVFAPGFNLFESGCDRWFAGSVPAPLSFSGLLPDFAESVGDGPASYWLDEGFRREYCTTATRLSLTPHTLRIYCDETQLYYLTADGTTHCLLQLTNIDKRRFISRYSIPIPVVAVAVNQQELDCDLRTRCFRDHTGVWYGVREWITDRGLRVEAPSVESEALMAYVLPYCRVHELRPVGWV